MPAERVAVIGDIGGHLDVFRVALATAGVDVDQAVVPDGLTVVQVGDLVHKGPESAGCVALADRPLTSGRYVQLWGNHEAHYVGGPDVSTRAGVVEVDEATQAIFRRWFRHRQALLAYAVDTVELGPTLVTHAGLTKGLWQQLGEPSNLSVAAASVNDLLSDPAVAFRPGWLMTGVYDEAAGVTCARTGPELAAPWLGRDSMPFSQVHGHESTWSWAHGVFHDDCPEAVREATILYEANRWSSVSVGVHDLWSVDWALGVKAPVFDWSPLVLTPW